MGPVLAPAVPHMLAARVLAAVALAAAAPGAAAQLSNRSVGVEVGLSAPAGVRAGAADALAVAATAWLDGDLEAVARLARWAGARTGVREADREPDAGAGGWLGTAGLRLSLLPDPLRPQLWIEAGWARLLRREGPRDRLALGAGAGLEWFVARDLSVSARCALRGAGPVRRLDVVAGLAAYF